MESNLNITGPNWSAFPYQFPHSLGPSHGFARQNSSCFFGIPCLKWPSLAKKSLEESVTRTVYPMVFGFAWRKCWNIMEHLLPSAFRTTALRPQKRNVSVCPVDFIPYDHNPLRRYNWIHFACSRLENATFFSRRFCTPQPRQVLKSSGWKVLQKGILGGSWGDRPTDRIRRALLLVIL